MNIRVTAISVHPHKARYCLNTAPGVMAILVRHGSTNLNDPRNPIVRGWEDIGLSPQGVIEAQLAAHKLRRYNPQYVYHSDFMRDSETAHIIAGCLNLPAEADFDARTWDVGSYSGQPEAMVEPAILQLYKRPWEMPPGSSESFNDFARRFIDFMEAKLELAAQVAAMRPVIIVTHGRCIALAQAHIEGKVPWECDMPMPAGFAVISVENDKALNIDIMGRRESVVDDV